MAIIIKKNGLDKQDAVGPQYQAHLNGFTNCAATFSKVTNS